MAGAPGLVTWLFTRGHAADLILAVMMAEGIWLTLGARWPVGTVAVRLAPGACLVLALRAALTDAGWPWLALWLALSFPAHLADLRRR